MMKKINELDGYCVFTYPLIKGNRFLEVYYYLFKMWKCCKNDDGYIEFGIRQLMEVLECTNHHLIEDAIKKLEDMNTIEVVKGVGGKRNKFRFTNEFISTIKKPQGCVANNTEGVVANDHKGVVANDHNNKYNINKYNTNKVGDYEKEGQALSIKGKKNIDSKEPKSKNNYNPNDPERENNNNSNEPTASKKKYVHRTPDKIWFQIKDIFTKNKNIPTYNEVMENFKWVTNSNTLERIKEDIEYLTTYKQDWIDAHRIKVNSIEEFVNR